MTTDDTSVADRPHQKIHLLAPFGTVKHHGDLATQSARSYFPTHHIRRGVTNTSPTIPTYIVYDEWHSLNVKEVEVHHCSRCIRRIGSYFPLRGGNTCSTYELKRLRNDLVLCLFKSLWNYTAVDIMAHCSQYSSVHPVTFLMLQSANKTVFSYTTGNMLVWHV